MPVSFLSTTQRECYGRYPDTLSGDELARYFHLTAEIRAPYGYREFVDGNDTDHSHGHSDWHAVSRDAQSSGGLPRSSIFRNTA